jgi:hypothetical protein
MTEYGRRAERGAMARGAPRGHVAVEALVGWPPGDLAAIEERRRSAPDRCPEVAGDRAEADQPPWTNDRPVSASRQ